MRWKCF